MSKRERLDDSEQGKPRFRAKKRFSKDIFGREKNGEINSGKRTQLAMER